MIKDVQKVSQRWLTHKQQKISCRFGSCRRWSAKLQVVGGAYGGHAVGVDEAFPQKEKNALYILYNRTVQLSFFCMTLVFLFLLKHAHPYWFLTPPSIHEPGAWPRPLLHAHPVGHWSSAETWKDMFLPHRDPGDTGFFFFRDSWQESWVHCSSPNKGVDDVPDRKSLEMFSEAECLIWALKVNWESNLTHSQI